MIMLSKIKKLLGFKEKLVAGKNKKNKVFPKTKPAFQLIFLSMLIILIFLPFFTTVNDLLTRIVEHTRLFVYIEDYIVPFLSRIVAVILAPFGFQAVGVKEGLYISEKELTVNIAWNCVGWQSMILIIITLITGLQGSYTRFSKAQAVLIGLLGTFLVNVVRIASVVLFAVYLGNKPAVIYHDYFSSLLVILWLLFFWWFSYVYVLERIPAESGFPQKAKTGRFLFVKEFLNRIKKLAKRIIKL